MENNNQQNNNQNNNSNNQNNNSNNNQGNGPQKKQSIFSLLLAVLAVLIGMSFITKLASASDYEITYS